MYLVTSFSFPRFECICEEKHFFLDKKTSWWQFLTKQLFYSMEFLLKNEHHLKAVVLSLFYPNIHDSNVFSRKLLTLSKISNFPIFISIWGWCLIFTLINGNSVLHMSLSSQIIGQIINNFTFSMFHLELHNLGCYLAFSYRIFHTFFSIILPDMNDLLLLKPYCCFHQIHKAEHLQQSCFTFHVWQT